MSAPAAAAEADVFPFDRRLEASPASIPAFRLAVAAFVTRPARGGDVDLDAIRLAVTEAVTNAVVHAYVGAPAPGTVRVRAACGPDGVHVVVSDSGRGMVPRADSPGLGMGMRLLEHMADTVAVRSSEDGTDVAMTFRLGRPAPPVTGR